MASLAVMIAIAMLMTEPAQVPADSAGTETESSYAMEVELLEGIVLDSVSGDGEITYPENEAGAYISYRDVKGIYDGASVITYLVYNPTSDAIDDVVSRIDFVVVE